MRKQTISAVAAESGRKDIGDPSRNNISGEKFRTIVHDKDERF